MKNKIIPIVIVLVISIVSMSGCTMVSDDSGSASDPFVKSSQLTASVSSLQQSIATKADKSELSGKVDLATVTTLIAGMSGNNNNNSSSNSYSKTEVYTKAEVDAIVAKAIADLKTAAPWASGTPNPTADTGKVNFTTTPVSIPQLFTADSGSQSTFYTMKIINNSSTWQYVKPIVNLTLASSYSPTLVKAAQVNMTYGSYALTNTNFSISPAINSSNTSSIVIIPVSGGANNAGEFQIAAGGSVDILIQITGIETSTTVLWNITNSISSRSL